MFTKGMGIQHTGGDAQVAAGIPPAMQLLQNEQSISLAYSGPG